MPLIYITGVSGSGKSAVRVELVKRGYKAFDTDEDRIAAFYNNETGGIVDKPKNAQDRSPEWYAHHTWKMSRQGVERLALQGKDNPVFLCGGASNDEEVWDLFSRIVALIIDEATLKKELRHARPTALESNPMNTHRYLRSKREQKHIIKG